MTVASSTNLKPSTEDDSKNRATSPLQFLLPKKDKAKRVFPPLPQTSQERLDASLTDTTVYAHTLTQSEVAAAEEKGKTVLYLAYGSNLCAETFRGIRGIKPVSQVNVQVPSLKLTFDLPGVPYQEPCFGNSAKREPDAASSTKGNASGTGYHKDRWHKDMVGCVYEVTPSDYAHIIATEGGGSSYKDILVNCYPLADTDTVPERATTKPFKAHTLFAPMMDRDVATTADIRRIARPDPSYAQPSARYLKLITDGAAELRMPSEYQEYLHNIRPFKVTTLRQKIGRGIFLCTWMPLIVLIFGLGPNLQDDKGRAPKWLSTLTALVFQGMWTSYDVAFKRVFGEGERTIGDDVMLSAEYDLPLDEVDNVAETEDPGNALAEEIIEETARLMGSPTRSRKRPELV